MPEDTTNQTTAGVTPVLSSSDTSQATVIPDPVQTDLAKIEAHITALEADGKELFADEIVALKAKAAALKAKVEAKAKTIEVAEQTFLQKYGQSIAHALEIGLLAYIAGRLAGLI